MADTPLPGYPLEVANKYHQKFDHTGPKSYANIGTSSGKGDVITAAQFGFGGFEAFNASFGGFVEGYSQSGNFIAKVFTGSSGTTPSQAYSTAQAVSQVVLQWFTTSAAFGAISTEVTNTTDLSAEVIRLEFWAV